MIIKSLLSFNKKFLPAHVSTVVDGDKLVDTGTGRLPVMLPAGATLEVADADAKAVIKELIQAEEAGLIVIVEGLALTSEEEAGLAESKLKEARALVAEADKAKTAKAK